MKQKAIMTKLIYTMIAAALLFINNPALSQTNQALDFDGSDDLVTVNGINITGFTGLTMEAWCYMDNYQSGIYHASFIIMKEYAWCGPPYGSFMIAVSSTSNILGTRKVDFGLNPSNNHEYLMSIADVPLHEWHHLAATWDGSYMRVYLDGIIEDSTAVTGPIYDMDTEMHIGNNTMCGSGRAFDGRIDEVRIWNVARTGPELRDAMYKELSGSESGLFAYYKLNEGSGQDVYDSSPNAWDGYLGNTTASDGLDPLWTSSTAPVPYYTVQDGNWNNDNSWADGQLAPSNSWSRVSIEHEIQLTSDEVAEDISIQSSGILNIESTKSLSVNNDFTNDAGLSGLVIESDASGTASLIESSTNVNATVQRHLTQNAWHFLGIPVESAVSGVFFIPGGSQVYLRTHIEFDNSWDAWITSLTQSLIQGRGYEAWVDNTVNQDETIEYTGVLNAGDYTTGVGGFYDLEYTSGHGLNLIANPYPSALQADISSWTKTNVANAVWVWSDSDGNYLYWNGTDGTNGDEYGTLTSGVIPAMQGFFVLATGSNPELCIPQSSRTHSSQSFYKNASFPNTLRINVSGNGYRDAIFIGFDENASEGFDLNKDVWKLFGLEDAPQLYTYADEQELSVNILGNDKNERVIPIYFECSEAGLYSIDIEGIENLLQIGDVYLEDRIGEINYNLKTDPEFSFNHNPDFPKDRFQLIFVKDAENKNENRIAQSYIWSSGRSVYICLPEDASGLASIYSIDGRVLKSDLELNEGLNSFDLPSIKGMVIVKAQTRNNIQTEKVYIQ
jgi:hypothetical protein